MGHAYLPAINREKWTAYKSAFPEDVVTVVTPDSWSDALFVVKNIEPIDQDVRVNYVHLPVAYSGNEVLYRYSWMDVWRTMNAVAPDVLLVEQGDNAFSYFQWILVSFLQFRFIPRLFFTWVNWKHQWGWRYRFFWKPIEFFNCLFSSAAIVGNPGAEVILREKGFKIPVLVSPQLGVSPSEDHQKKDQKHSRTIGFVGRLAREKGVHLLLEAFARQSSQYIDWDVCIVGSGPENDALVRLSNDLGIKEKVVFTGSVDHYRAIQLIQSFDILVLPSFDTSSWKEQFGHVIIEAMAAGVPVIGSDAGAIAWVIGDAGLVFAQKSIEGLSEALCKYMSQEEVCRMYGERGLNRVREVYGHEVIARNIGNFLHSLI